MLDSKKKNPKVFGREGFMSILSKSGNNFQHPSGGASRKNAQFHRHEDHSKRSIWKTNWSLQEVCFGRRGLTRFLYHARLGPCLVLWFLVL